MAMYTIFHAPLQMLADSPTMYMKNQPCTDFIAAVPTVWDETVAIDGRMGDYVVMARRKGDTWWVAAMGDWQPRDITIDLSRLQRRSSLKTASTPTARRPTTSARKRPCARAKN